MADLERRKTVYKSHAGCELGLKHYSSSQGGKMLTPSTQRQTGKKRQVQVPIQRALSMHAAELTATPPALHYAPRAIQRVPSAGSAKALPSGLRAGIESLSRMDMSAVRVHYASPLPAQLSALAYAQGNHIHLARGEERHLPHEAWHIVQQRQGRVKPTLQDQGVPINDDAALEREADTKGAHAAQRKQADWRAETTAGSQAQSGVVQRYLIVDDVDHTRDVKVGGRDLNARVQAVKRNMEGAVGPLRFAARTLENTAFRFIQADDRGLVTRQIRKWIEDKRGVSSPDSRNAQFGRKNQSRSYANYHDLALAIYGWVSSKEGRREEKLLANEVYASPIAEAHIDTLLGKISAWIATRPGHAAITADLASVTPQGTTWADYADWFNHVQAADKRPIAASFYPVLQAPGRHSMRDKIATFHDVMNYFVRGKGTHGAGMLDLGAAGGLVDFDTFQTTTLLGRVAHARPRNTFLVRDRLGFAPVGLADVGVSTEEQHPGFIYARSHQIPMWARHSFTAARMMRLAEQAGATHEELTAAAYSITAFWRKDYDHRSLPYHTLHEVMDFRPHFGLLTGAAYPYNPLTRYADARTFLDPLPRLMPRLTFVANSANWNNRARLHRNDAAPDSIIAIRAELGTAHTNVDKLLAIKNEIAGKTGFSLTRTSQARRFYTILAHIPDNVSLYQAAGTTSAVNSQIATRLSLVLRNLIAFNP
jgi:hypothetical protein